MARTVRFTKMHGLGNSYVFLHTLTGCTTLPAILDDRPYMSKLAQYVANPNFGIGSDGLIAVIGSQRQTQQGEAADARSTADDWDVSMTVFNSDGSEADMCGNGLRCVAALATKHGYTTTPPADDTPATVRVLTGAGVRHCEVWAPSVPAFKNGGRGPKGGAGEGAKQGAALQPAESRVRVSMGRPAFALPAIPMLLPADGGRSAGGLPQDVFVNRRIDVAGAQFTATALSVGNPHCVVIEGAGGKRAAGKEEETDEGSLLESLPRWGPQFGAHPSFPEGVNTEFCRITSETSFEMRCWERGSGETLACGTGAAAAAVACMLSGRVDRTQPLLVRLRGGDLHIEWIPPEAKRAAIGEDDNGNDGDPRPWVGLGEGELFMRGPAVEVCEGIIPLPA